MSDNARQSPGNPASGARDPGHVLRRPEVPSDPRTGSSKIDTRRSLGAEGEARAASFLRRRGYRIEERNVRYDGVEIDLIARRGAVVVFVEVKTRRTTRFGPPELAVDRRKQQRMIRAALAWSHQHPGSSRTIRFDVIACSVVGRPRDHDDRGRERDCTGDDWKIKHLTAAFHWGD